MAGSREYLIEYGIISFLVLSFLNRSSLEIFSA